MYKIVKEIHTYQQNKVVFKVYEKYLWSWSLSEDFYEYETYELAEQAIINFLHTKHGGIISLENNVYKYRPLSFTWY